ncbi:flagellar basal body-associated FliL family protein [Roseicyclus mahoneyensis]|uniref:Flagellar protein FliL n=1 Tax=Roseicyclus mahoneyensis TaxID=164332 RepID=A0A316GIH6_9RHOB|nr:flagellar basal body-associated FliL family protein [Roseicyclus mahoneyensis]PWK59802.1 hypothetical protein C7455_10688 [Roseicyclus mahoneyensis]
MLRLILPILLLLVGVAGGVGAGMLMAPSDAGGAPAAETTEGDAAASENPAQIATPSPGESVASATGLTEYVRLNNQFVVPIVRNGAVRSLVVMSLSIEVDAGTNSAVFDREPRLRDSFLQVMFAHANAGGFDGSFTQAQAMGPLREALREAARRTLGPSMRDVLIVDITRQDA